MTSEPTSAYVWTWLPGHTDPVVAGRLDLIGPTHLFTYGRSYLDRPEAIALHLPDLPARPGRHAPLGHLTVAGVFDDAAPDAWGRRVIEARRTDRAEDASLLGLLLESGSDRPGALDFQGSPDHYVHRGSPATLEQLLTAAQAIELGHRLPRDLDDALLHGSSLGGARPKAALSDQNRSLIAKFSSTTDTWPVVNGEAAAMLLARRCGVDTATVELAQCLGRDVLLVERFDRGTTPGARRSMVSALTILGLAEHEARYATYFDLAEQIRARFHHPEATLIELFRRIVVNVAVSNTDDHARNHAAFWDGHHLELTPAYDICPQARTGQTAQQALAIGRDGSRWSTFACCIAAAAEFHLSTTEATEIVDHVTTTIHESWAEIADQARLTATIRDQMWGRQILNPYTTSPDH